MDIKAFRKGDKVYCNCHSPKIYFASDMDSNWLIKRQELTVSDVGQDIVYISWNGGNNSWDMHPEDLSFTNDINVTYRDIKELL